MENKQPILSICIPTFNRAEYLEEALYNICSDPAFNENVEIVISDNASTDNTQSVVEKYSEIYSNIHYFRNEVNIKDKNFILALSRGKGKYVRLFNDTLRFKKNGLQKLINIISKSSEDIPLYIFQEIDFIGNQSKHIKSIDELLEATSFMTTWIGNMGNWNIFIDKIKSPNRYSSLKLCQVDWHYQIITFSQNAKIEYGDFFITSTVKDKGGYNIYNVFITNYFTILRKYNFSSNHINKEKYLVLKHFIAPWTINIYINKNLTFSSKNKWNILLNEYWNKVYFYKEMFYIEFYRLTFYIKKTLKEILFNKNENN